MSRDDEIAARYRSTGFDVYAVPDQELIATRKRASRKRKTVSFPCTRCGASVEGDDDILCERCRHQAHVAAGRAVEGLTKDGKELKLCPAGHRLIGRRVRVRADGTRECVTCTKEQRSA